MTQFFNAENIETARKGKKETTLSEELTRDGWRDTHANVISFEKVIYLGKCIFDGDMFAGYSDNNTIQIYKGIKGEEFND
jgi:hypothetical protein